MVPLRPQLIAEFCEATYLTVAIQRLAERVDLAMIRTSSHLRRTVGMLVVKAYTTLALGLIKGGYFTTAQPDAGEFHVLEKNGRGAQI